MIRVFGMGSVLTALQTMIDSARSGDTVRVVPHVVAMLTTSARVHLMEDAKARGVTVVFERFTSE